MNKKEMQKLMDLLKQFGEDMNIKGDDLKKLQDAYQVIADIDREFEIMREDEMRSEADDQMDYEQEH